MNSSSQITPAADTLPRSPQVPGHGWRLAALWAALIPSAAAVVLFGAVRPAVNAALELVIYLATAMILITGWRRRHPWPVPIALLPLIGFGGLVFAQWAVPWTQYRAVTLDGLGLLVACGCIFYLGLIAFSDGENYRLAARAIAGFAAVIAAEAIVQKFTSNGMIYGWRDATFDAIPIGPFTYHNYYAAFVELVLPISMTVAFHAAGRIDWSAYIRRGLAPALLLASFMIAQSRGGVIVLAAELIMGAAVIWFWRRQLGGLDRRLLLAAAGTLAFTLLASWGPLATRLMAATTDASAADRLKVAQSCLAIWWAHPWVGTGLGTFATVYPKFRIFDNGLIFLQAHNDTLQLLAETGVVGFGLALAFLGLGIAQCRHTARTAASKTVARLKLAAAVGCAGFCLHCCMDFVSHSPANAYLFWFLAAMAMAGVTHRRKSSRHSVPRRPLRPAAVAASPASRPRH